MLTCALTAVEQAIPPFERLNISGVIVEKGTCDQLKYLAVRLTKFTGKPRDDEEVNPKQTLKQSDATTEYADDTIVFATFPPRNNGDTKDAFPDGWCEVMCDGASKVC